MLRVIYTLACSGQNLAWRTAVRLDTMSVSERSEGEWETVEDTDADIYMKEGRPRSPTSHDPLGEPPGESPISPSSIYLHGSRDCEREMFRSRPTFGASVV
ncbi:hypothetical protein M8J77_018148 [Diaphorina citri]|nr:hypothetical protein M8J77_018148 [Diaphorina citri]